MLHDPQPRAALRPRTVLPRRVLLTRSAALFEHGQAMVRRAQSLGLEVEQLAGDRLPPLHAPNGDTRASYRAAKSTLAIVAAPPSKLRFQPISPSADWRVDLAEGCPAHCAYCYLAGSLKGPPITRAYANIEEIERALPGYLGRGQVTSRSQHRAGEGTTFEASCYTDPLGIEPLTGSLQRLVGVFGRWEADVQLRFTTKYADVEPLLALEHNGRTRMRASVNPRAYAPFEAGTSPVAERLQALRRMAEAGYPVGLTIAPIIAAEGWREAYGELIGEARDALAGIAKLDLTVELITHRFTPGSREVLRSWYPGSKLEMDPERRAEKRTKFGSVKHVYDRDTMKALRAFFEARIASDLPQARILYWT